MVDKGTCWTVSWSNKTLTQEGLEQEEKLIRNYNR